MGEEPQEIEPGRYEQTINVRGQHYAVQRAVGDHTPLPRPVRTRVQKSTVSFGPVGRIAMTVFVFSPLVLFLATGLFFFLMLALALLALTPWVLKDIWRPVDKRRDPPSR